MKLNLIGPAALSALILMAFATGNASATTLEVQGVTRNESLTLTMSLEKGTSATLSRTDGSFANTCTESHMHLITTVYTGTVVTGALTGHPTGTPSDGLSFSSCTRSITVHDPGTLEIDHIKDTNGRVYWKNAQVTVGSPFGTLNCKPGETAHFGTLTGVATGHATLHVENTVINCGFLVPSMVWSATYIVTSPTGLGVSV